MEIQIDPTLRTYPPRMKTDSRPDDAFLVCSYSPVLARHSVVYKRFSENSAQISVYSCYDDGFDASYILPYSGLFTRPAFTRFGTRPSLQAFEPSSRRWTAAGTPDSARAITHSSPQLAPRPSDSDIIPASHVASSMSSMSSRCIRMQSCIHLHCSVQMLHC